MPVLLALPHPQPVLRTIFARGSLRMEIWEAAPREIQENTVNRGQKEAGGVRIASQTVEEPERAKPPLAASGAQEGVQRLR